MPVQFRIADAGKVLTGSRMHLPNHRERHMQRVFSVSEARRRARRALPSVLFDFVDGGADDEVSLAANERIFDGVRLLPRILNESIAPDISASVLGSSLSLPVVLAPCGGVRLMHPDGDRAVAQAAGRSGTAFVMSMASASPLESVAEASQGPHWFQVYLDSNTATNESLLGRASSAGFSALFVTVDAQVQGNRERDRRHRVKMPLAPSAYNVVHFAPQLMARPRWTLGYIRDGLPTSFGSVPPSTIVKSGTARTTWGTVAWLREVWSDRLVLKGILSSEDARRAVDEGVDAIAVSNHGGRQLDGTPAPLAVLPGIRAAVGDQAELLIDGGIRRGSDVVKAVALGADAVMIGRPYLYGLAIGGTDGVSRILEILRADITRTLTLLGLSSIREVGPGSVDARELRCL